MSTEGIPALPVHIHIRGEKMEKKCANPGCNQT